MANGKIGEKGNVRRSNRGRRVASQKPCDAKTNKQRGKRKGRVSGGRKNA